VQVCRNCSAQYSILLPSPVSPISLMPSPPLGPLGLISSTRVVANISHCIAAAISTLKYVELGVKGFWAFCFV
jgi:hypothetical protein